MAFSLKPPRAPEMAITRGMVDLSMVALTGMPVPRVVSALKLAVSAMNWLSAVRNWGRMSSMLAINLPAARRTTFKRTARPGFVAGPGRSGWGAVLPRTPLDRRPSLMVRMYVYTF